MLTSLEQTRDLELRRLAGQAAALDLLQPSLIHDLAGILNALTLQVALIAELAKVLPASDGASADAIRERAGRARDAVERLGQALREFGTVTTSEPDAPLPTLGGILGRARTLVFPFAKKRGVDIDLSSLDGHGALVLAGSPALLRQVVVEELIHLVLGAARTDRVHASVRKEGSEVHLGLLTSPSSSGSPRAIEEGDSQIGTFTAQALASLGGLRKELAESGPNRRGVSLVLRLQNQE